jgi:hypothetical protein
VGKEADGSEGTKLDMIRWIAGFQNMALAAAANEARVYCCTVATSVFCTQRISICQAWTYTASMAHLRVCLELAAGAHAEKRAHGLAQIYDELCRSSWTEKALRGAPIARHVCDKRGVAN